jgi:ribosomal protein L24E
MLSSRRWRFLLITLGILSMGLSCKGERKSIEGHCDYDGVKIEPIYAVYFILQDGKEKKFCSIVCASMSFSELKKKVKEVMVVDEVSEEKITASRAFFVESEVVTTLHVKNRIHVFSNREDAERHLKRFKGKWIENPFRLPAE